MVTKLSLPSVCFLIGVYEIEKEINKQIYDRQTNRSLQRELADVPKGSWGNLRKKIINGLGRVIDRLVLRYRAR